MLERRWPVSNISYLFSLLHLFPRYVPFCEVA